MRSIRKQHCLEPTSTHHGHLHRCSYERGHRVHRPSRRRWSAMDAQRFPLEASGDSPFGVPIEHRNGCRNPTQQRRRVPVIHGRSMAFLDPMVHLCINRHDRCLRSPLIPRFGEWNLNAHAHSCRGRKRPVGPMGRNKFPPSHAERRGQHRWYGDLDAFTNRHRPRSRFPSRRYGQ